MFGAKAAWIAAASCAAFVMVGSNPLFGLLTALAMAVPVAVIVQLALQWRPHRDKGIEWFPARQLAVAGLVAAALFMGLMLPGVIDPPAEQERSIARLADQLVQAKLVAELDVETFKRAVTAVLQFVPGIVGVWFLITILSNFAIGQWIAVKQRRNLRPSPSLTELELPRSYWALTAIATFGAISTGAADIVGTNLLILCFGGFYVAGLAVLHTVADRIGGRKGLLVTAYILQIPLLPTAFPIYIVAMLVGALEPVIGLRRRFGGGSAAT
jgi:hypothetical protein